MGGKIFVVGKNERECLSYMRQSKLEFVRGLTVLVTNGQRHRLEHLERQDRVVILRGADRDVIELVHKNARISGITLGGSA